MNCKKVNEKKYLNRKSPPFHAKDCPQLIKKGNDGLSYISKKDVNNVYKWILLDKNEPQTNPNKNKNEYVSGYEDPNVIYQSIQGSDGKYHWTKTNIKYKSDPDTYYKQFSNYIKPVYDLKPIIDKFISLEKELKKIGVKFYFIKWSKKYYDSPFIYEYFYEDVLYDLPDDANYLYVSEKHIYTATLKKMVHSLLTTLLVQNYLIKLMKY
jgi:hypothetical protein